MPFSSAPNATKTSVYGVARGLSLPAISSSRPMPVALSEYPSPTGAES